MTDREHLTGEMVKINVAIKDYNERDLKEHAELRGEVTGLRSEVAGVHNNVAAVSTQVAGVQLEVANSRTEIATLQGSVARVVEIVDEERQAKTLAIQDAAHAKKSNRELRGKVIGGLVATVTAIAGFLAHALSH